LYYAVLQDENDNYVTIEQKFEIINLLVEKIPNEKKFNQQAEFIFKKIAERKVYMEYISNRSIKLLLKQGAIVKDLDFLNSQINF